MKRTERCIPDIGFVLDGGSGHSCCLILCLYNVIIKFAELPTIWHDIRMNIDNLNIQRRRNRMSFKKCRDLILGIVMLAFSAFYLIFAQQIKTRPKLTPAYASARIMPTLLGVLLAALSVFCILQGIRRLKAPEESDKNEKKLDRGDMMAVVFTFAVIIGYILIMPILGFILSTVIYLFLQMLILAPADKRNFLLFAIVAVVFTALVFVAFRVGLQQLLPRGVIENLLGF